MTRNKRKSATFPIPGAKAAIFENVKTVDVCARFLAESSNSRALDVSIALYHLGWSSTERNEEKDKKEDRLPQFVRGNAFGASISLFGDLTNHLWAGTGTGYPFADSA